MSVRGLRLERHHWEDMLRHVEACVPEEACGLLAGKKGIVQRVLPIENTLHSPVRFRMEPQAQIEAFQQFEAEGLELLAIFHSHPNGPAGPSPTDLTDHAYPNVAHIIWSRSGGRWSCHAFCLDAGKPQPVPLAFDLFGPPGRSSEGEGSSHAEGEME